MKPTIRSIAQMAGVSRGTVSRVVNHQPNVNPHGVCCTRARSPCSSGR